MHSSCNKLHSIVLLMNIKLIIYFKKLFNKLKFNIIASENILFRNDLLKLLIIQRLIIITKS